jgi:tripartite-type tricarboxylate transporter receptor subunit TctC
MKKIGVMALLLLCLALSAFGAAGAEQKAAETLDGLGNYPSKPIQCIVPAAAGGGNDSVVRTVQKYIKMKQPIVVLNVPGANNMVGAMQAYESPNDGYTILGWAPIDMICITLTGRTKLEMWREMEPIACVASDYNIISTNKASGFRSIEELVAYAKAHPGEIKWGTTGAKNLNIVITNKVLDTFGIKDLVTLVPYDNGSQAQPALMGNHVQVLTGSIVDQRGGIDSGDFTPLVVSAEQRVKSLPSVPTMLEKGINSTWPVLRGFFAPKGTSEVQMEYIEAAIKDVFNDPTFISDIEKLGISAVYIGRDDMKRLMTQWEGELNPLFATLE